MGLLLDKLTKVEYPVNDRNPQKVPKIAEELIEKGDVHGLRKLIQRNTDVTISFPNGTTLLHLACLHQQVACLKFILERKLVYINTEDNSCETALNSSLLDPVSFECSDLLITAGININLKNTWLRTPLLKCVIDQNEATVLYLLSKGANPNTEDCMGCTPLNQSVYYHLHQSFNRLIKNGADIDYVNQNGNRALNFGCKSLNKYAVNKLIKLGATVDIAMFNKVVCMPFEENKKAKFEDIFRLLISALGQPIPFSSWTRFPLSLINNSDLCILCLCASDLTNWLYYFKTGALDLLFDNSPVYHSPKILDSVPSLKHMSRITVRKCLIVNGGNVISNIKYLDIPPGLKSVILLQDVN